MTGALSGAAALVGMLDDVLRIARGGGGSAVSIAGEAGIGKTHAVEDAAARARRYGAGENCANV